MDWTINRSLISARTRLFCCCAAVVISLFYFFSRAMEMTWFIENNSISLVSFIILIIGMACFTWPAFQFQKEDLPAYLSRKDFKIIGSLLIGMILLSHALYIFADLSVLYFVKS